MVILVGILSLCLGVGIGYYTRYKRVNKAVVLPPPSASPAPYEVRLDGRVLYNGWDLAMAKQAFKQTDLPHGLVLELYSHGNHTTSRRS